MENRETVKQFIERFIPDGGFQAEYAEIMVRIGDYPVFKGNKAEVLEKLNAMNYEPIYCDSNIIDYTHILIMGV